jgi:hypothetical protein
MQSNTEKLTVPVRDKIIEHIAIALNELDISTALIYKNIRMNKVQLVADDDECSRAVQ